MPEMQQRKDSISRKRAKRLRHLLAEKRRPALPRPALPRRKDVLIKAGFSFTPPEKTDKVNAVIAAMFLGAVLIYFAIRLFS